MTIEQEIAALLAKAEPLRALPEWEQGTAGLAAIVEQINALRAIQAREKHEEFLAQMRAALDVDQQSQHEAEFATVVAEVAPKRGPGRPRKEAA